MVNAATAAPVLPSEARAAWSGFLDLGVERRENRTALVRRYHYGPLRVQRPFYPEGDQVCHIYVLHPPGGIANGDDLNIVVRINRGAGALVTTPAAAKFYRCAQGAGRLVQRLRVAAQATLEWLPQETIVFDGARADAVTQVHLAAGSRFIGWEIVCLGRPACRETFQRGRFSVLFQVFRDDRPLYLESGRYVGGEPMLAQWWGLAGFPVIGSMVATLDDERVLQALQGQFNRRSEDAWQSVTGLDGLIVVRYMGTSSEQARRWFERVWQIIRPALLGRPACAPRIWRT